MIAVVGVRLHEPIDFIRGLRPVVAAIVFGILPLLLKSGPLAIKSFLDYPVTRILAAYFIWIAFTVPFALWPGFAFGVWRGLIGPLLMYVAVLLCTPSRKSLETILWWTAIATAVYLVLNFTSDIMQGDRWRLGSAGSYDPNDMAGLFAVVIPVAGALALRSKGLKKLVAFGICVLLVFGVIQTGSRGGVLAMLAGVLIFVLGQRGPRLFLVTLAVSIGGVVGWQTSSEEFRERMATFTALDEDYNIQSEMGRVEIWKRSVGYFAQNPLTGVGPGNFPVAEGRWLTSDNRRGKASVTHNGYLQAFSELGVIGGCIFLGLFFALAARALKMWRVNVKRWRRPTLNRPEFFASLAAVATSTLFLSMAYSWILLAVTAWIALADRVLIAEEQQQDAQPTPARARNGRA
jgi:O-antigen ligase